MFRSPDKIAYRHGDRTRTYRELLTRVDRVSSLLTGLGLQSGEHGAIIGKNDLIGSEFPLHLSSPNTYF